MLGSVRGLPGFRQPATLGRCYPAEAALYLATPPVVSSICQPNFMKLSVIVATRNRAHAIAGCLDSIAVSLAKAAPLDAEIIVVDNGSQDATSRAVEESAFPVRLPMASAAKNSTPWTGRSRSIPGSRDHPGLKKRPNRVYPPLFFWRPLLFGGTRL
jgi:hypothetical protein